VLGFPARTRFSPDLEHAEFRVVGSGPTPVPLNTSARELLEGDLEANLVTLEATLLEHTGSQREPTFAVQAGNTVFAVRAPVTPKAGAGPTLEIGSRLRLTGICQIQDWMASGMANVRPSGITLLLRSAADLAVLERPPWWTVQRLRWLVVGVGVTIAAALGWIWLLRARVVAQTRLIQRQVRQSVQWEERQRIAREIHDNMAQGFMGLGFQMEALAAELPAAPGRVQEHLALARKMLLHCQEEVRRSLRDLRPLALEHKRLPDALPEAARQSLDGSSLQFDHAVRGAPFPLPALTENNILRIGQEAVTNAARHARAQHVRLELIYETGRVELRVTDDGVGFDWNPDRLQSDEHFGLNGMFERAGRLHATLAIACRPGEGTEIVLTVPIQTPAGDRACEWEASSA
ncbi:MAG: sensor histidine kinase, partial [Opitutaceae bacterium]